MNAKAQELFQDKSFLERVLVLSAEDAQKAFAEEGGEISVEELNEIADAINKFNEKNGELDEEDLKEVAGGLSWGQIKFAIGIGIGIGIVCAPW